MADAPPPYSDVHGHGEKSGPYPPPGQGGYPQGGYGAPPQGGYGPPPQGGYGAPSQAGYPPQGGYQGQGVNSAYPQPSTPGYGPSNTSTHNTVVVTQQPMTVVQTFHEAPVRTLCPHCRADIVTATQYETGTFSWLICVILCLVGCNLGCCLIPFCMDGCQDVIHTCPNCRQQISRWSRM
ncbi:cell death-inducing p53-target protein 1-like [Littorina saxatilis]